ncbi:MAG: hypothetical protein WKF37_13830 [Bryobacteraceae bacterium]
MPKQLQAALLALVIAANASAKHKEIKPGWNLFSKEQDVQLGREAAAQVEQQMPVVRDAELNGYIQRVGKRPARHPKQGNFHILSK